MLSIFPIFVDALDVFNRDGPDKYTGNEFCNNGEAECSLAVMGTIAMALAILLLIRAKLYGASELANNVGLLLMFAGNILLFVTIFVMTFTANENTEYLNECFVYATNGEQKQLCRVQYFGTQILYPLLICCAIVDFWNAKWDNDPVKTQNFMINRLIWFSLALLISSSCTLANLIGNSDIYQRHILANTSYYTCTTGYFLIVFVSTVSIIIQTNDFNKNWRREQRVRRFLGYLTLIGVLLIQSRTFADLFVFCCMCLMMAADIQVVKE